MKRKFKRSLFYAALMISALMMIGLCEECFAGALISAVIFALIAVIGQALGVWEDE